MFLVPTHLHDLQNTWNGAIIPKSFFFTTNHISFDMHQSSMLLQTVVDIFVVLFSVNLYNLPVLNRFRPRLHTAKSNISTSFLYSKTPKYSYICNSRQISLKMGYFLIIIKNECLDWIKCLFRYFNMQQLRTSSIGSNTPVSITFQKHF